MECQSLVSGKSKKNLSKCHLLNFFLQHAKHYFMVTNILLFIYFFETKVFLLVF